MIDQLINDIKNIEEPIFKVMIKGFKFSFMVCLISFLILVVYNTYPTSHIIHKSSLILFRTGVMFAVQFFICAFATDIIKKQMN